MRPSQMTRQERMTMHDTCQWPPSKPCLPFRPGVRCAPLKDEYRLEHDYPQKPDFALAHNEPIVVNWPPEQGQGDTCEQDTGIREDLLMKIPNQISPQVVTVHGSKAEPAVLGLHETLPPVVIANRPHEMCPDSSLHMRITPPHPEKPEIRIPDLGCAVRQPTRRWRQCIENTLINDRVRRPMARWCHKRPMPPLVIPTCELQRLKDKCTEHERKKAEREARIRSRECARLESRKRMGAWNYTVESLLAKKKEEDDAKDQAMNDGYHKLVADIKKGRDEVSMEQTARARKLQLYGKGLIKDFHSQMQLSKTIQDAESSGQKQSKEEELALEKTLPVCDTKCMQAMIQTNDRPEYPRKRDKPKIINPKLLKKLQSIEIRQKEQEEEKKRQIQNMKKMLKDNLPGPSELPAAYLKLIKEPECDVDKMSQDKFKAGREELNKAIDESLAMHEYIESHEREVERQACEYRKYKLHKDKIRKDLEKRLIQERVDRNMAKAEAAARVLAEIQKEKKARAENYSALKEKWEQEIQDREDERKEHKDKLMELVIKDYLERKGVERCKTERRGPYKYWAMERMCAVENYEQECERKDKRRKEAEEIQLYNQAMAAEKKCQEERLKMIDEAWAVKVKSQYFEEIQEMKDYAQDCIQDWIGKGRTPIPMHYAMKKWETDSAMNPRMFREYEEKKRQQNGDADRGGGDADGLALLLNSKNYVKKNPDTEETTQSTTRRLGFC